MRPYRITPKMYDDYLKLINEGSSKAAACRKLKVADSTMRDYIKRNYTEIEYALIKRKDRLSIVVGSIFSVEYNSPKYSLHRKFYLSLSSRSHYIMTQSEFEKYVKPLALAPDAVNTLALLKKAKVEKNEITYKGVSISHRLFSMLAKKNAADDRLAKFADLLIQNPDVGVRDRMYDFLVHNNIEICKNGYILAHKIVSHDFKDLYTGKIDNRVGKTVSMNRKLVDPNPNVSCSTGLHVGSLSYINGMYGNSKGHIVNCIVNPIDVVCVPYDYNGAKVRLCKYKVVSLYKSND